MLALAALLALAASASAVDMSADNFNALVKDSGKNAFIKFQAPW
jgi:hypothetical protein